MKGVIRAFEPVYMARIAQLTNKSNQFNLTTRRYTQAEIEEIAGNADYITLYGKLIDRFGDNGVVSVVIGHKVGDECRIDLWIMSCRVLKRDMEFAMMDTLVEKCRDAGLHTIRGFYYPTAKNAMVKDFYALQGFTKVSEDEKGNSEWTLEIEGYVRKNEVISLE
jgi:FkbH-like protein